jgi:hypothetical protein
MRNRFSVLLISTTLISFVFGRHAKFFAMENEKEDSREDVKMDGHHTPIKGTKKVLSAFSPKIQLNLISGSHTEAKKLKLIQKLADLSRVIGGESLEEGHVNPIKEIAKKDKVPQDD